MAIVTKVLTDIYFWFTVLGVIPAWLLLSRIISAIFMDNGQKPLYSARRGVMFALLPTVIADATIWWYVMDDPPFAIAVFVSTLILMAIIMYTVFAFEPAEES